jgi:hypothetical protein
MTGGAGNHSKKIKDKDRVSKPSTFRSLKGIMQT